MRRCLSKDLIMQNADIAGWLADHPDIDNVRAVIFDINGVMRGKRLPVSQLKKAINGGVRMPFSSANLDIWGRDIAHSKWVFETGDADGDSRPFDGDPRNLLASILDKFAARKLYPVAAFEMEFYLADPGLHDGPMPQTAMSRLTGAKNIRDGVYSLEDLSDHDALFNDIYDCCQLQDVAADAAISEAGSGQFEINLLHGPDCLKIADDAMLFKQITKGVAGKHGLAASFMAKPYADRPGNGMHVHLSIRDQDGQNIFYDSSDDASQAGSAAMQHAVAGLLAAMPESMLIFAPHHNSYRRFAIESHAPMAACWGYENRTAALRIPLGPPEQRRIEHRVAGADTNPYLMLAVILAGVLAGLDKAEMPPPALVGSAYDAHLPALPASWENARDCFANATVLGGLLPDVLRRMLLDCKAQEMRRFAGDISAFEYQSYLDQV
jgi:glutamine synthetase